MMTEIYNLESTLFTILQNLSLPQWLSKGQKQQLGQQEQ